MCRLWQKCRVGVLSVTLLVGSVQAAQITLEDFEGDLSAWNLQAADSNHFIVGEDPVDPNNMALLLVSPLGTDILTLPWVVGPNDQETLSFRVLYDGDVNTAANAVFIGAADEAGNYYSNLRMGPATQIDYSDANDYGTALVATEPLVWYSVLIDLDMVGGNYDLYIDGTMIKGAADFNSLDPNGVANVMIQWADLMTDSVVYVDDIVAGASAPSRAQAISIAGAYTDSNAPAALPQGWDYLYSDAAIDGNEVALDANVPVGNGGNIGFGGPASFSTPVVLGRADGDNELQIFTDGFAGHAAVEGTDLLLHPGSSAETAYVIVRYTIREEDLVNGSMANIAGSFRDLCGRTDKANPANSVTADIYLNDIHLFSAMGADGRLFEDDGAFNISRVRVAVGDTISFVVGNNSNFAGDETALEGSIEFYGSIAGDYVQSHAPVVLPEGWAYLYSDAATDGNEVALTANTPVGNAGNVGFGGPASFSTPVVLGRADGENELQIFSDGFAGHAAVEGSDLLLHPGNTAETAYVIARYTVSDADILNGGMADIVGSFRDLCGRTDKAAPANSVTADIYLNDINLFSVTGAAGRLFQVEGAFTLTDVAVAPGDTISFVVGNNGNFAGDETALEGLITF